MGSSRWESHILIGIARINFEYVVFCIDIPYIMLILYGSMKCVVRHNSAIKNRREEPLLRDMNRYYKYVSRNRVFRNGTLKL